MDNFSNDYLPLIVATAILIWGLAFLIRTLKNQDNEKLSIWLDFGKYFLGTFVLGLLGYFAKLSYDKRNLAIMETDQIGKYVEQALSDDVALRIRFADYFNTVLPETDRNAQWDKYVTKLLREKEVADSVQSSLGVTNDSIENLTLQLETSTDETTKTKLRDELSKLYQTAEKGKSIIEETKKIGSSGETKSASIVNPTTDFVTCKNVVNNRPTAIGRNFYKGKVWLFARIYAPRDERVTVNWYDASGELLSNGSKSYQVRVNTTTNGYRISTYKNINTSGNYAVELLNGEGIQIAFREFQIY